MKAARIDVWVWVLVYAGLIGIGLGLAIQRNDVSLGWAVACIGAALVAAGALLIWIRSRLPDDTSSTEKTTP
jgi:hypothetical protein